MTPRPFDGARDVLGHGWRDLQEFAARTFERDAMFVFAACRIRAERRNAASAFNLYRLRPPGSRRAVRFRRQPLLNMPAIDRGILRLAKAIDAAGQLETIRDRLRRVVRFA